MPASSSSARVPSKARSLSHAKPPAGAPEFSLHDLGAQAQERIKEGEAYVQKEPLRAVAYTFVIGYLMSVLPIGALVRAIIRTALFALKPAAVIFGALKVFEIMQQQPPPPRAKERSQP